MKLTNNKGFTLIELILVIVIMGILMAVAIPKFSGLLKEVRLQTENAVISQLKAGLEQSAAENLVTVGQWDYPAQSTDILSTLMDEVPDGWTYLDSIITYTREDSTISWKYTPTDAGGAGRGSYTIVRQTSVVVQ
ncbi:prepilin-type N-terminal cleavage/methylation domain-containing protein [bacterium]|nr:prepilin-type N-terminal cleavage/methylation domain-containing protein [bacterium]